MGRTVYHASKFLLWTFYRAGYALQVRGQAHVPAHGPFILASNHSSFLDPPVVGVSCPRPVAFMARETLFRHWALGAWLRGVQAIPLRRDAADLGAIRAAVERLRHGEGVAIFPEGTRQLSGQLGTAKRGVGLLAEVSRAPVVPVLVQGTFEALPPDARGLRPSKIRVAFGPAISYTTDSAPTTSLQEPARAASGAVGSASRAQQERVAQAVTESWRRLQAGLDC